MTREQEAQGDHQKREPLTIENEVETRNEKESILREFNERITRQHHFHLVQKVAHFSKKRKRPVRRKNIVVRRVSRLHQVNQIWKQISTLAVLK